MLVSASSSKKAFLAYEEGLSTWQELYRLFSYPRLPGSFNPSPGLR